MDSTKQKPITMTENYLLPKLFSLSLSRLSEEWKEKNIKHRNNKYASRCHSHTQKQAENKIVNAFKKTI
jgi:hypothetical protein